MNTIHDLLVTPLASGCSTVAFNRLASWNGFRLYRWGGPQGELQDFISTQHQITIPLAGTFMMEHHSATGRREVFRRTTHRACVLPAGRPCTLNWRQQVDCLTISLDPTIIARAAADALHADRIELIGAEEVEDPLINHLGLALLAEAQSGGAGGAFYAETLGYTLAIHLLRHYSTVPAQPTFTGGLSGSRLRRVREFINEHLDRDLTLAEMAAVAGLSPYHFARAFKRSTGRTPQQYMIERRIERAKQLLAKSELPIVEISASTGFKNQSHFTTTFRRLTAMTPKAYRIAVRFEQADESRSK